MPGNILNGLCLTGECCDDGFRIRYAVCSVYMPMQYTENFFGCKNENFHWKKFDIFLIFAQNIDCGYTLEPPQRGGSNEYPQSMFWSKNKKNRYTPAYPSFA